MKKKIIWITADYFIDCDIEIINHLASYYIIDWHIILPTKENRFSPNSINKLIQSKNITISYYFTEYRHRNPQYIPFYLKLIKNIKHQKPEIIYFNFQGFPYFAFICAFLLKKRNTIFAVHQAEVHEGMHFQFITRLYFRFLYSTFINFNLFSNSQAGIFKRNYPNKRTFIIPLGIKDFGVSSQEPPKDKIVFFNFGTIIKNKNIGLLIKAACNLYERGFKNFTVKIVGSCENWEQYKLLIKYPNLFQLNIESIENSEIPDLFCSSHYLVLPYSAVSQSGPLKIAFNYNIPVIASDLPAFKSEIIDNETGYLFQSNILSSLEDVLIKVIKEHEHNFERLKSNQREDVRKRYSTGSITQKYVEMFNSIEN